MHMQRIAGMIALGLALGLTGCPGKGAQDDPPARQAPPNPPAPEPSPGANTPSANAASDPSTAGPLLAWLDPDAVSVAYLDLPQHLRSDAVAVVYGLPPRAEDLLQAVTDLDHALDAIRPTDSPATDTWLSPRGLVTVGRLARRPTVLHPLRVPKAEAIARLEALGLVREEDEVFEIWAPQRVFPYKVVMLEGEVAAFIPAAEPGSGLSPLAAARDQPPSDVETQLGALLSGPDAPTLALFAAGPMLHFDLSDDVLAVRFELRRASDGSLDGQLALQIEGDPAAAAKALEDRTAPEQSDRIQQLVERAAYVVDAEVVAGRLQLSAADAKLLVAPRSGTP
ncbi:MAG: hypothetical protein AAGF11_29110 [Myxococcota bacterium]